MLATPACVISALVTRHDVARDLNSRRPRPLGLQGYEKSQVVPLAQAP
jgi:hypothetical protein